MFTCALDARSRVPLCEQLCAAFRAEIERGALAAGERLPSKRELALHLGVSTSTVETAYAQLVSEGYCESRPRSGVYVSETAPRPGGEKPEGVRVLWDFLTGAADAEHFPYATWARLMREVLGEQDKSLLLMGDAQGLPGLREAISALTKRLRGVELPPECVVVGAGTETLVSALVPVIGRERLFAVESPGYPRVWRILSTSGARLLPTPLLGGAIDPRPLYTEGAGAAYVTPSRQFPTGAQMSARRREELLRWSRDTGGYILEDDCDGEFRFSGAAQPTLRALDGGEQVVYMNTFARTLAPGLRLSFMALPQALVGRYRMLHSACSVSGFEQETLRRFIEGGHLERHVARMRVVYRGRLQAIERLARAYALGEVEAPQAGLYALLRVGGKTPAHELAPRAARAGVRLTRLADYGVVREGSEDERVVLLGFAGMGEEEIAKGMAALRDAWM